MIETLPLRTAFITGAAKRLGRAIALELAAAGWAIAVHHYRSGEEAAALVAQIEAGGGHARACCADLADLPATLAAFHAAADAMSPIACLINNASRFDDDTLQTMTPEGWEAQLAVNLRAPAFLAQAFATRLPQGVPGCIINILDQRVLRPRAAFFSYGASKAGLAALTVTMAQALGPRIRVNAVAPGPTLQSVHQSTEDFAAERAETLLGRGAEPEDIARAVRFLVEADSATGQTLALDGGQHLR